MFSSSLATKAAWELRHAVRRLVRAPGFAALAIGMFVVGIGVNAAMFALMDALFFRPPFHVADPAAVYKLHFTVLDRGEPEPADRTHYPNIEDLEASGAFEAVAAYRTSAVSVGRGAEATTASGMLVSPRFFEVLGPAPHLGQLSLAGDGVVISHAFWQRYFASASHVPGRTLTLDGRVYTIAGVAPVGFHALSARAIDVWVPLDHGTLTGMAPSSWRSNRDRAWLYVVARLRNDRSGNVATEQASAVLLNRGIALKDEERVTAVRTAPVVPGREGNRTLEGRVAIWLGGVSALVLLIACANVANLVGARVFAQRRDGYIRLTLGASPGGLIAHALFETWLIIVPAAAGALLLSFVLRNAVAGYFSLELPLPRALFDARTLGFTAASTAMAFATIAAVALWELRFSLFHPHGLLSGTVTTISARRSRRLLLAVQSCLCLVLLFLAGLFATSLHRAQALDLGVDIERTIQVTLGAGPGTVNRGTVFAEAHSALAVHPDVEAVAVAEASPFMSGFGITPRTSELSNQGGPIASASPVGPGFFAAVGTESLRGRDFSEADRKGAPPVAIINAPLAARLWPNGDGLGRCMWLDNDPQACTRVIGIIEGFWKINVLERDRLVVYLPLAQHSDSVAGILFVRPRGRPEAAIPQIRTVVQTLRPDLPAASIVLMRDVVAPQLRPFRLGASVFSAFAAVALLIAAIGLYGVVAAATALRVREIGVRIALGANRRHVARTVAAEGVPSVLAGLTAGAALITLASRWFGGVLFETSPRDPGVIAATAGLLLVVSLLAMTAPVIRALRINPVDVLRSE